MTTFDLYIDALRRFARIQRETAARYRASCDRGGFLYAARECDYRAAQAEAKIERLTVAVDADAIIKAWEDPEVQCVLKTSATSVEQSRAEDRRIELGGS